MNSHTQRHRNAHPDDQKLFNGQQLLRLQKAVYELCWLFNHGYSRHSAITTFFTVFNTYQRLRATSNND